jgi:predicted nucleic acid-binding protein
MAAKNEPEDEPAEPATSKTGIYIDSSALAKLYTPEPESDTLDRYMQGRRDLKISELCITEVVSAVARRKREGAITAKQASEIRKALYNDAQSGSFQRLDISPAIHRHAEQMLLATESVALRTLDALHIALALAMDAQLLVTFDSRMADAAALHGLEVVDLS